MDNPPITRGQVATALERAMDDAAERAAGPVDDEHLALLLEGRLDELAKEDRRQLLHRVATDPELSAVVAQAGAGPGERDEAAEARPAVAGRILPAVVRLVWAVAACAAIGLGIWRYAEPTRSPERRTTDMPDIHVGASSAERPGTGEPLPSDKYWKEIKQQQAEAERDQWHTVRDYALLGSMGVSAILSVPVVYWALGGLFRPRHPAPAK